MDRDTVLARGLRRSMAAALAGLLLACAWPRPADAEVYSFRDRGGVLHFTNAPTDIRFKPAVFSRPRLGRVLWTPRLSRRQSTAVAPEGIDHLLDRVARRHGIDRALVHAVARAESNFDPFAVSRAGAQGIMQLMPETALEMGVVDPFRIEQNIEGGVGYLRRMLERFDGDVRLALAAYNDGPGAVERHGNIPPFPETEAYLRRVFLYRQEFLRSSLAGRGGGA